MSIGSFWVAFLMGLILLPIGCQQKQKQQQYVDTDTEPETTGSDSDTDTDTDTDSDTDSDTDADIDAGPDTDPDTSVEYIVDEKDAVYFVVDSAHLGLLKDNEGCDINGNGKIDNKAGPLSKGLSNLTLPGVPSVDPDAALALMIDRGTAFALIGLFGVNDYQNDDVIRLKGYQGEINGYNPDAGVLPDDIYSGHGQISFLGEPHTDVGGSITDGKIVTLQTDVLTQLPFGGKIYNIKAEQGKMMAQVEKEPNGKGLGGKLIKGMICGAITVNKALNLMLQYQPQLNNAIIRESMRQILRSQADIVCLAEQAKGRKEKNCISLGMGFTAVSVEIVD